MTRGAGHRDCDEVTDKGAGLDIKGWGFEIGGGAKGKGEGLRKGGGEWRVWGWAMHERAGLTGKGRVGLEDFGLGIGTRGVVLTKGAWLKERGRG